MDFDRQISILAAKAIVQQADDGTDIPDELVKRAKAVLEIESLNDQVVALLASMKGILGDFDPNNSDAFPANFKKLFQIHGIMGPAFQNLGDRMKAFKAEFGDVMFGEDSEDESNA